MISPAQVEQYHEQGYVVVDDVLTPAQVTEGRRIVEEFTERSRALTDHDELLDLEDGHSAAYPSIRRLKHAVYAHRFFDTVMRSAAVLDPVSQMLGPNIRFHNSKLNVKSPGYGSPVEWHQDFAFFPHTNDDLAACGIALDDSDAANGCLLVIPGSHRGRVVDHHQHDVFVGAIPGDSPELAVPPVAVEVRAGSMSLHHARLLHASAPTASDRIRRVLFLQYAAADAFPLSYSPAMPAPSFAALDRLLVRGEPTYEARLSAIQVSLPRYGESYGSIYEVQERLSNRFFAARS